MTKFGFYDPAAYFWEKWFCLIKINSLTNFPLGTEGAQSETCSRCISDENSTVNWLMIIPV